jgi:hypothetical protein
MDFDVTNPLLNPFIEGTVTTYGTLAMYHLLGC